MKINWTFVILALIFLIVGGFYAFKTVNFLEGSEKSIGTITAIDGIYAKGRSRYATIAFQTAGTQQSARVPIRFSKGQIGDRISVYYNPKTNPRLKIDSFSSLWLFPLMLSAFGLISVVLTFIAPQKS